MMNITFLIIILILSSCSLTTKKYKEENVPKKLTPVNKQSIEIKQKNSAYAEYLCNEKIVDGTEANRLWMTTEGVCEKTIIVNPDGKKIEIKNNGDMSKGAISMTFVREFHENFVVYDLCYMGGCETKFIKNLYGRNESFSIADKSELLFSPSKKKVFYNISDRGGNGDGMNPPHPPVNLSDLLELNTENKLIHSLRINHQEKSGSQKCQAKQCFNGSFEKVQWESDTKLVGKHCDSLKNRDTYPSVKCPESSIDYIDGMWKSSW